MAAVSAGREASIFLMDERSERQLDCCETLQQCKKRLKGREEEDSIAFFLLCVCVCVCVYVCVFVCVRVCASPATRSFDHARVCARH